MMNDGSKFGNAKFGCSDEPAPPQAGTPTATPGEIEITFVQCYQVRVKSTGQETSLMRLAGEWNGMLELRSIQPNGGMLVVEAPNLHGFATTFRTLFNSLQPDTATTGNIIKGSPELLARLFIKADEPKP